MTKKILIAHGHTSIEIFHTILPFVLAAKNNENYKFKFLNYNFKNIFKEQGDLLILIRKYHDGKTSDENIIYELQALRKNFTKIVYFDDSAATSIIFFCAFPYVDQYWKRACLKNKEDYKKKLYGGHIYSNFYYKKFDLIDEDKYFINPVASKDTQFNKLKLAWNIGVGIYPVNNNSILDNYYNKLRKFLTGISIISGASFLCNFYEKNTKRVINELNHEVHLYKKVLKISSRFSDFNYRKSVGFQRKLAIEMTRNDNFHLSGFLQKKDFTKEIFSVLGILSPFGWGEVCYRDFEAVIAGAYLIKPDMSHLETWPNIYKDDYYYSLDWNLSEIKNLENILDNLDVCEEEINKVRSYYKSCLTGIVPRCLKLIDGIF